MIDPKDQSVGREPRAVRHHYSKDELDALREQFANAALKRDDEEEAYLAVRREFKARIDYIRSEAKTIAKEVRNRYRDDTLECWLVPNFETNMMEFYAIGTNEKVDERRLRPDERQLNLVHAQ